MGTLFHQDKVIESWYFVPSSRVIESGYFDSSRVIEMGYFDSSE